MCYFPPRACRLAIWSRARTAFACPKSPTGLKAWLARANRPRVHRAASVSRHVLDRTRLGAPAGGAVRRQTRIADLVEQGAVADAQGPGCLLPIPVVGLQ